MKHKSNRQSSRAVDKGGWQKTVGERGRAKGEQQRTANKHKMPIKRVSRNARGRQIDNRQQTGSKMEAQERGAVEATKWRRLLPVPSTSKASQRCTVNLRSRFITGTMRHGYGNSSLFHAVDQLPLLPPTLLHLPPRNSELPHALALNASLTTCPWSGPLRVKRTSFRAALWARCGSTGALAINIFCSIKWTNLMCCHGYMAIYANRWLDWLDRERGMVREGEGETLSTLAGHSKQDLWQACVGYVGLG